MLLHYFFLVTFMWMLMEGVVLYVALVKVFVKHTTRYIIAFTAVSYGELITTSGTHPGLCLVASEKHFSKTARRRVGMRLALYCVAS